MVALPRSTRSAAALPGDLVPTLTPRTLTRIVLVLVAVGLLVALAGGMSGHLGATATDGFGSAAGF
jgi:hypothetical protein